MSLVADDVGIPFDWCQAVLGMKRAAAKTVQKQHCMYIAQEMLTMFNNEPDLLKKVITGDESWLFGYDIETKAQSSQWKRPKKARQVP